MPEFLKDTLVFAGRLSNQKELEQSSSGGAFTALSNWALTKEYPVVCSSYNYAQHSQTFSFVTNMDIHMRRPKNI